MNVFVKNLSGKIIVLKVTEQTTIRELKAIIMEKVPSQFNDVYLATRSVLDDDDKTLFDYKIQQHHTIYMLARLRGGLSFRRFDF